MDNLDSPDALDGDISPETAANRAGKLKKKTAFGRNVFAINDSQKARAARTRDKIEERESHTIQNYPG